MMNNYLPTEYQSFIHYLDILDGCLMKVEERHGLKQYLD